MSGKKHHLKIEQMKGILVNILIFILLLQYKIFDAEN